MDLSRLAEPFPLEDIEWRPTRAGRNSRGIYCAVIPYITARGVQSRFDEVCGIDGWRNEEPRTIEVNGKTAFVCGMSIRLDDGEWLTKWNVCEPTSDRGIIAAPAKGGWSGAEKRAGSEFGCGRYLYYLDEVYAEVTEERPQNSSRQWKWAELPEKHGGGAYWWKPPGLPAWALPKEPEHEITEEELTKLKRAWMENVASDALENPSDLREGFTRFVYLVCGEFPVADYKCWTRDALKKCAKRILQNNGAAGIDSDVPFEE